MGHGIVPASPVELEGRNGEESWFDFIICNEGDESNSWVFWDGSGEDMVKVIEIVCMRSWVELPVIIREAIWPSSWLPASTTTRLLSVERGNLLWCFRVSKTLSGGDLAGYDFYPENFRKYRRSARSELNIPFFSNCFPLNMFLNLIWWLQRSCVWSKLLFIWIIVLTTHS